MNKYRQEPRWVRTAKSVAISAAVMIAADALDRYLRKKAFKRPVTTPEPDKPSQQVTVVRDPDGNPVEIHHPDQK